MSNNQQIPNESLISADFGVFAIQYHPVRDLCGSDVPKEQLAAGGTY